MNARSNFDLRPGAVLVLLAFAWSWVSLAQQPKDSPVPSSEPSRILVAGPYAVFLADDGEHGRELWITEGTEQTTRLLTDLVPGPRHSAFHGYTFSTNGLFLASTNANQSDVYQLTQTTIGSGQGFVSKQLGTVGSDIRILASTQERIYFSASRTASGSELTGRELWIADMTAGEIRLVVDLWPGFQGSDPGYDGGRAVLIGDLLYFVAYWRIVDGKGVPEAGLWRTDGTEAGTTFIAAIEPDTSDLTRVGENIFFASTDSTHGRELWVSDGTTDGTRRLTDINPGTPSASPSQLTALPDKLIFEADDGVHGQEPWLYDLSQDKVQAAGDVRKGVLGSKPYAFTVSGNFAYFVADDGKSGKELWVWSASGAEPHLVKDINPGESKSEPYELCNVQENLFFCANDGSHGEELWCTDGTESGTRLVRDIYAGPAFSEPYDLINLNDTLLFAASDPVRGRELWRSDGTEAGTVMVKDIYSDPFLNPSSSPRTFTVLGNNLFFVVNDIEHGAELWVMPEGSLEPRLVRDIFPGKASSNPEELRPFGDILLFRADDGTHGTELWRTDGTPESTIMVADICEGPDGSYPQGYVGDLVNGYVVFSANDRTMGDELWRSDGRSAQLVMDIRPGAESSSPREITIHAAGFIFRANDGVHGEEIWITTGEAPTTRLLKDIVPTPLKESRIQGLTPFGNRLVFSADDDIHGQELWSTDGTFDGTRLTADIRVVNSRLSKR